MVIDKLLLLLVIFAVETPVCAGLAWPGDLERRRKHASTREFAFLGGWWEWVCSARKSGVDQTGRHGCRNRFFLGAGSGSPMRINRENAAAPGENGALLRFVMVLEEEIICEHIDQNRKSRLTVAWAGPQIQYAQYGRIGHTVKFYVTLSGNPARAKCKGLGPGLYCFFFSPSSAKPSTTISC